jgi:hypothetical protein
MVYDPAKDSHFIYSLNADIPDIEYDKDYFHILKATPLRNIPQLSTQ